MRRTGILLFAHGSRDPAWAQPMQALQQRLAARSPDAVVGCAYLELMTPDFASAVAEMVERGCSVIRIAPVFWARGRHLNRDLRALIDDAQRRYPDLRCECLPVLSELDGVLDAVAEAIQRAPGTEP